MNIDAQVAKHSESPYSHLLVFVQEFVIGNLKGMTYEDSLPFCSDADARGWVDAISAKAKRGKVNYRVIESTVVRLCR
jgi:hypothetical protein